MGQVWSKGKRFDTGQKGRCGRWPRSRTQELVFGRTLSIVPIQFVETPSCQKR